MVNAEIDLTKDINKADGDIDGLIQVFDFAFQRQGVESRNGAINEFLRIACECREKIIDRRVAPEWVGDGRVNDVEKIFSSIEKLRVDVELLIRNIRDGGYVNAQVKISSADVIGLRLGMSFEQVQSTLKSLYPSHKLKVLNRRGGGAMGLAVEVESNSPKICSYGCPEHIQLNFGLASNRLWIIQRRVVAAEPVSPKVMTEELIKKYGTPTKIWALGFQVSTGVDGKPKEGCSGILSSSERYKDCGFSFDASYSQNSPVTSYSVNFSNLGELWRDDEAGRAELAAASAEKNAEAIKRTSNNKPSL